MGYPRLLYRSATLRGNALYLNVPMLGVVSLEQMEHLDEGRKCLSYIFLIRTK